MTNILSSLKSIKVLQYFISQDTVKEHLQTYDPNDMRDFIDIYLRELKKDDVDSSFCGKRLTYMRVGQG